MKCVACPDFVVAGAGIVGLSLALELARRGASVLVVEAGAAGRQTSSAAAGMLAVHDPANPAALLPLSQLSRQLYPAWLDRIAERSGTRVPFQTFSTLETTQGVDALPDPTALVPELAAAGQHFALLDECSVDPRQLVAALLRAVRATPAITLQEHTALGRLRSSPSGVVLDLPDSTISTPFLVDCMGTWSPAPVRPRKGQMLAVRGPASLDLQLVIRTPELYVVPRTAGPDAGRLVIGATIEDAGFDLEVHPRDILQLNARAVQLLPCLAKAEFLESWSGLRPLTADGLPFLGPTAHQPRYVLATGHFRNGILLAPATAHVIAQLLFAEVPDLDLGPYSPERLARSA